MASLLDQDFGSESEDDNFNPAPADESDNEVTRGPDGDVSIKRSGSERRGSSIGSIDSPESLRKKSGAREANGHRSNRANAEEDAEDEEEVNGSDRDDDDEEEEDDDEDEEEAVTV